MATINIISQPERLRPTHYPNVYKFNETVIGVGTKTNFIFSINSPVVDGDTFKFWIQDLTGTGRRVVVVARDVPSNGDIPTTAAGYTITQIVTSLVNTLNSNQAFNWAYRAFPFGLNTVVQAIKTGSIYNTAAENNLGATPQGFITSTLGTDTYVSDGYSSFNCWLDVYDTEFGYEGIYDSTSSQVGLKVAAFARSKNDDNEYYFDLSDYLKSKVNNDTTPLIKQTRFNLLTGSTGSYNIHYGYNYTSGSTFNFYVEESAIYNQWVINASIPFFTSDDSFSEYQTYSGRTFLTNQPRIGKIVDEEESSPLCFFTYLPSTASTFTIAASIEYTFTDGSVLSSLTAHYFDTNQIIYNDGVYYADVGPANLPIASIENLFQKEIASYEVRFQRKVLSSYTDELTERIKFILDKSCKDNKKRIYWRNEIGGIDSWTFNGKTSQSTEIEQSLFQKNELNNENVYVPSRNQGKVNKFTRINCSSGWMDEAHYNWMVESLLASPAIWINETGNDLERIILIDSTATKDSDQLLYSLNMTFEKAFVQNKIGK